MNMFRFFGTKNGTERFLRRFGESWGKKSHQHVGVIVGTTNAPFASLTTLLHKKCQHKKHNPIIRIVFYNEMSYRVTFHYPIRLKHIHMLVLQRQKRKRFDSL